MNKYLLIDVLIIGGGGAGGNNNGGGGGAGGFQFFENIKLNYQKSYNIIVGNGGIALDKNPEFCEDKNEHRENSCLEYISGCD